MPGSHTPSVYVDSCLFLNVLLEEPGHWRPAYHVLRAAHRRDIRLVASRLLAVEVGRFRGDTERVNVDAHVLTYLEGVNVIWHELDILVAREARRLSWEYGINSGADAVHLATAVHAECNYFMSSDAVFPYDATIGKTKIMRPDIVWDPTMEDEEIDQMPEPKQPRPSDD